MKEKEIVEKLLFPLWRCVDSDYKKQYKKDVWQHFENALKNSSNTSSLQNFLTVFQKNIPTVLESRHQDDILEIVECGEDKRILKMFREKPTYLTLLVRQLNEEVKENYKAINELNPNELYED